MRTVAVVTAGLSQPSSSRLLADQLASATDRALRLGGEEVRVEVVELRTRLAALRRVEHRHGAGQPDPVGHHRQDGPGRPAGRHGRRHRGEVGGEVGQLGADLGVVDAVGERAQVGQRHRPPEPLRDPLREAAARPAQHLLQILGLQAIGLAWLASITSPTVAYSSLVPAFVISGIGMALFFAPVANVVLSSVKREEEGMASGANNAIRELGGVFGVAVLASIFSQYGGYESPATYVDGLTPALWVGAAIVGAGAVAALFVPRKKREAEAVEAARPEVLQQDVGATCELLRELEVLVVLEVERDRALVAINGKVIGRFAVDEGRPPGAGVVALARQLDLDHVGAHVAQHHRAIGAGHDAREIDDANAAQGQRSGGRIGGHSESFK